MVHSTSGFRRCPSLHHLSTENLSTGHLDRPSILQPPLTTHRTNSNINSAHKIYHAPGTIFNHVKKINISHMNGYRYNKSRCMICSNCQPTLAYRYRKKKSRRNDFPLRYAPATESMIILRSRTRGSSSKVFNAFSSSTKLWSSSATTTCMAFPPASSATVHIRKTTYSIYTSNTF